MTDLCNKQIPPPGNWDEFQALCCDLWKEIWLDPNTQQNGRQGQGQNGVDIFGQPKGTSNWAGIQCKVKKELNDSELTENELIAEVNKAKGFVPKLNIYIITTTAPRDAKIQQIARQITEQHQKIGLFTVTVCSWEEIVAELNTYREIFKKYYPTYFSDTTLIQKADIIINVPEIREGKSQGEYHINYKLNIVQIDTTSSDILNQEHQSEIDYSRELLKKHKPQEAINLLSTLKGRIWSTCSNISKYRILTNIGSALLKQNKEHDAANKFIEAFQYNTDDEKALCNKALAHLIYDQKQESIEIVKKVLKNNPSNGYAYSILLQTFSDKDEFETILEKVPEPYRIIKDVSYTIAHIAVKYKKWEEAEKWLDITLKNSDGDDDEIKARKGEVIISSIVEDISLFYTKQVSNQDKERIKWAIDAIKTAWEKISLGELREVYSNWPANISIAKRVIGDVGGALIDIESALKVDPSNNRYKKLKAMLLCEKGDKKEAQLLLENIPLDNENPDIPLLLAEIYIDNKKPEDAIKKVNEFIKSSSLLNDEANMLLTHAYLEHFRIYGDESYLKGRKDEIVGYLKENSNNTIYLINIAAVSYMLKEKEEGDKYLKTAKQLSTKNTDKKILMMLADELHKQECYDDAADIYEMFVDDRVNTISVNKMIDSYYKSGKYEKVLNICKNIKESSGFLPYVTEVEAAIYEEIGSLPDAIRVCQEYILLHPDDFRMKLRKAFIDLRNCNQREVEEFLKVPINIKALSLDDGIYYSTLLSHRGMIERAFEVMYEIRRKYYHESRAHLRYVGITFENPNRGEKLINIDTVALDTAVCIQAEDNNKQWYIIENREDPNLQAGEIGPKHPIAEKVVGKKLGDKITLIENSFKKETGTIVEVLSKYVYAYRNTLEGFEKLFPNTPGLIGLKIGNKGTKEDLAPIFNNIDNQNRRIQKIVSMYKTGSMTIGAIAQLLDKNPIEILYGFADDPDIGIKASQGDFNERYNAYSAIEKKPRLIIDITSLTTIHNIGADEYVKNNYGKLGISQTTIDSLRELIKERERMKAQGYYLQIGKEGNEYVKNTVGPEDIKKSMDHLEGIIKWVNDNCVVIPCKKALAININKKHEIDKLIGVQFSDTVLIASEPGNILFSDDERLRSFAKSEFNVDGVWTQLVLLYGIGNKNIIREDYNKYSIKLVGMNYRHTAIDADILLEAIKQSKWTISKPYAEVRMILAGGVSDDKPAINVATNFIYNLFMEKASKEQRSVLIFDILNNINLRRDRSKTIRALREYISIRFKLVPFWEDEIKNTIDIWQRVHIT